MIHQKYISTHILRDKPTQQKMKQIVRKHNFLKFNIFKYVLIDNNVEKFM